VNEVCTSSAPDECWPAQDAELRHLALVFIEILARKRALPVDIQSERRLEAILVRDLELTDRTAEHQSDAVLAV